MCDIYHCLKNQISFLNQQEDTGKCKLTWPHVETTQSQLQYQQSGQHLFPGNRRLSLITSCHFIIIKHMFITLALFLPFSCFPLQPSSKHLSSLIALTMVRVC